jgi:hypothetical protein
MVVDAMQRGVCRRRLELGGLGERRGVAWHGNGDDEDHSDDGGTERVEAKYPLTRRG